MPVHFLCFLFRWKGVKVSGYLLKQNKIYVKKTWQSYLYIFLQYLLKCSKNNLFNIYNLSFLRSANIGKVRVKVAPKTNYFSYILSSFTNRIAVFNNFFSLTYSQPRGKQTRAHDLSKYFLNNQLLSVFMQNTLNELLKWMNYSLLGKTRAQFCAAVCWKCVCKVGLDWNALFRVDKIVEKKKSN